MNKTVSNGFGPVTPLSWPPAISPAMTFADVKAVYIFVTRHVIPGPRTWSWLAPFVILPVALMVPPQVMSQKQLICYFLVPIFACFFHAWWAMGCWDAVAMDSMLWATMLLALDDPRVHFKKLRLGSMPDEIRHERPISSAEEIKDDHRQYRKINEHSDGAINSHPNNFSPLSPTSYHAIMSLSSKSSIACSQATPISPYIEEPYPLKLLPRLLWSIDLASSDRLAHWLTGKTRHDTEQRRPPPTRRAFCLTLAPQLLTAWVLLSLTTQIAQHDAYLQNPYFVSLRTPFPPPNPSTSATVAFLHAHIPPLILRPLTIGFYALALIIFEFALLGPPAVLLNYLTSGVFPPASWSPHTLPPYFGSFTEGVLDNGVRGLWGTFWHKHLTYMVLTPGKALAKAMGRDGKDEKGRRHWEGYALPLASAFLFSGLVHMGLVPQEPGWSRSGLSPWNLRLRIAGVFWVQPVGVGAEMAFVWMLKKVVPKGWKDAKGGIPEDQWAVKVVFRVVRLAWVLVWLCCASPLLAVPFADMGYWNASTAWWYPGWVSWLIGGGWLP